MARAGRVCSVLACAVLILTGCTAADRADDPAAAAVRDSHSALASLVLSARLMLDGRATTQVTQVVLDQALDDVSTAQQELVTATGVDPQRRKVASDAIGAAVDALVALDGGADQLGEDDVTSLQRADDGLAAAGKELHS